MAILKRVLFALPLLAALVQADEIRLDTFKLLNTNDAAAIIDVSQAQDLLNVDISKNSHSIKKRSGYGTYKTLGNGSIIHGGYHFYDSSGNDVQLWGAGTNLYGVVADAAPTILVSSATTGTTWDCTDSQGFAYCVDSSRDLLVKTNGATITWYTSPLGTMVASTPDRLLIAGVNAAPNSIYISQSATPTNFVAGINVTDPFVEPILSPGSKLTHIEYACNNWMWWKDQSFGYILGTDQTSLRIITISNTIGTNDNSSVIDPSGAVWFRGQDGHIYRYDCSSFQKMTRDISAQVQSASRRIAGSWTQTTQSDFQTGVSTPTNDLSFTISGGDVVVGSFTVTENSSTAWTNGSVSNLTVNPSSITLTLNNSGSVTNPDIESALTGNWTLNHAFTNNWQRGGASGLICGTVNPQSGSFQLIAGIGGTTSHVADFQATDLSSNILQTVSIPASNDCTWRQLTLTPSTANLGRRVKFRFHINDSFNGDSYMATSDSYIWGGAITFYYVDVQTGGSNVLLLDNVQAGSSTVTTGSFTSQALNTGFSYSVAQASVSWSANTSTPTFNVQTSSNSTGPWSTVATSSGTDGNYKQYVRYTSTISVTSTDNAQTGFTGFALVARSSGSYYSAVKAAPNLTSWDTMSATKIDNSGSHTFFIRSATNTFSVSSATPSWVAQTNNAVVSASTGTFFQFRDDFATLGLSSATPTLNDFTINWFEGTASDKAYGIYFDEAIWWTVAFGSGQSTNNYIFKYDLVNQGWTLYNIGTSGFLQQNSSLYFGSTTNDKVYRYGNSTDDNGSAISAYWKSKDFTGTDPWLADDFNKIDVIAKTDQNQTLTVAYTTGAATTSTSYSVSLSSSTEGNIFHRKLLPPGVRGNSINLKLSDNSTGTAWEVMGFRITYAPQTYRPSQ